jgi:hypothetical protein
MQKNTQRIDLETFKINNQIICLLNLKAIRHDGNDELLRLLLRDKCQNFGTENSRMFTETLIRQPNKNNRG